MFLDLGPLLIELGNRVALIGRLAAQLPEGSTRIKVMDANQLESAQDLTKLLKTLGSGSGSFRCFSLPPLLALAACRPARDPVSIGVATIVTGLLVLAVRKLGGSYVVDELVVNSSAEPAAGNAWEILTRQLATAAGPSWASASSSSRPPGSPARGRSATATRAELAPYLARAEVAFGAAALFAILLIWSPTVQTTRVPLMIAAAVVLAFGVEVLRVDGRRAPGSVRLDLSDYTRERLRDCAAAAPGD